MTYSQRDGEGQQMNMNRGVEWESNKKKGLCYILSWYFSMSVLVWETNTWRERKNF